MFVKDVLDFWYGSYFSSLQLQKGSENSKKTRFSKEEIKKQLIDSIINIDVFQTEELNEKADKAEKPEDDATTIIKQFEDIICTKKKNVISIAYHQGKVSKRFKDKEKFLTSQ